MRVFFLALAALAAGCVAWRDRQGDLHVWTPGKHIEIQNHHVCTVACNHYQHEGRYYEVEARHVHGDGCGHFFHQGRWQYNHGHIHKIGCGHKLLKGHWVHIDD